MAVLAFKSSSRRTNITTPASSSSSSVNGRKNAENSSNKKTTLRRSRSVSAFSRSGTNLDVSSSANDFLNKRDNPLFWATSSPPDLDCVVSASAAATADDRRGRSVARNAVVSAGRKEVARSLSRVDSGRRNRSVSRCPVSRNHNVTSGSEAEAEQEYSSVINVGNRRSSTMEAGSDKESEGLLKTRSSSDMANQLKGLRTWSSQHSSLEPSHDSSSITLSCTHPTTWEGGVSTTSSLLGVEEKTIKAVCEQMKSSARGDSLEGDASATGIYETVRSEVRRAISEIQNDLERAIGRSNTSPIATTNITDIPPDLVNPSAVELVLDIRREYAKKLEQSQERARKLRADLAVEDHRGQELSRILKEVLPDPKTSNAPKSRTGRKTSMERRKVSKRLTEEAMAYFDECVLSTFDSSDFSSQEDPPVTIVGITTPVANSVLSLQASSSGSATNSFNSDLKDKQGSNNQDQIVNSHDVGAAEITASSSHMETPLDRRSPTSPVAARDWKSRFSFARKASKTTPDLQQDIQKYIRNSERGEINLHLARSNGYDLGEYNLQATAQSFVLDRVVMRNRIESGSLLLCCGCGSTSVTFSPFASFF